MKTYNHRFYIGPHSPLSVPMGRVIKRNADQLLEVETECPPSGQHREILSNILKLPEQKLTDWNTHQIYVDFVLSKDTTRDLIYNYDAFLGSRKNAFNADTVYPSMEQKIGPLRLFTMAHKVTVFLCLQNYTDLIESELKGLPKLQAKIASNPANPQFSWQPFVSRLQSTWPEAQVVIIDASQLAMHWAAIVALFTGHPKAHFFKGINDFSLAGIDEFGRKPFEEALLASPPKSIGDWLKISSKVFSQYGHYEPEVDTDGGNVWTLEQLQYSRRCFAADITALRKSKSVLIANDLIADFK